VLFRSEWNTQHAFYLGRSLDGHSPVSGPYMCVCVCVAHETIEHVFTRCSLPSDVYFLHPSLLLSTPSRSSSILWPSPLGWALLQWNEWDDRLSLGTFRSHLSFSLYPHSDCIMGEHHSHMSLPQRTHVTSDLLRGYKLCFIQSRMWDIPISYLQLPTVKCSTIWSVQDDIK